MASDAQKKAQAKYDKANTTQIKFKLNNKTDKDILEFLAKLPSKQEWFKQMARECIEKGDTQ